ncbi:MAG: VWA domain-containing protein [Lentisphaerae bacterium]|nr:VWA domain-containing protein [Lentisphaerota bacterium]
MFRFANPVFFALFAPLALAAWFVFRRRRSSGLLFAPVHRLAGAGGTWRARAAAVLPACFLAGLALAVIALARPQTLLSRSPRTADAIAVEMVVDVSGSMEALDMSDGAGGGGRFRTRLDAVKETFAEFVRARPDDLIGLVTFGGFAATRAPLTADHEALLHVLEGVEIPSRQYDDARRILNQEELLTAVGDALATACARLEHAATASRIIVLLSDGESNTGLIEPAAAVRMAEKMGVRVYTIGVGTTGQAPFLGRDAFGRQVVYRAFVTLDEELLRDVAKKTGGRYFNVRDPNGLQTALGEIDRLEKTRIERELYERYNELFPRFLVPAAALAALGAALNVGVARRIV